MFLLFYDRSIVLQLFSKSKLFCQAQNLRCDFLPILFYDVIVNGVRCCHTGKTDTADDYPRYEQTSCPDHAAAHTQAKEQCKHNAMGQGHCICTACNTSVQLAQLVQLTDLSGQILLPDAPDLGVLCGAVSIFKRFFLCQCLQKLQKKSKKKLHVY